MYKHAYTLHKNSYTFMYQVHHERTLRGCTKKTQAANRNVDVPITREHFVCVHSKPGSCAQPSEPGTNLFLSDLPFDHCIFLITSIYGNIPKVLTYFNKYRYVIRLHKNNNRTT